MDNILDCQICHQEFSYLFYYKGLHVCSSCFVMCNEEDEKIEEENKQKEVNDNL